MRYIIPLFVLLFSTISTTAQDGVLSAYQLPSSVNEPKCLTATSDRAYFIYDDGSNGNELWYIDEATDKAKMAIDHLPGKYNGVVMKTNGYYAEVPDKLGVVGKFIYYLAFDDTTFNNRRPFLSRYSSTTNRVDHIIKTNIIKGFKTHQGKLYIHGELYGKLGIFEHDPTAITMDSLIIDNTIQDFDLADGKLYYSKSVYQGKSKVKVYEYDLSTRTQKVVLSTDSINGGQFDDIIGWHCYNEELYFVGVPRKDSIGYIYNYTSAKGATLLKDKNTGKSFGTAFEMMHHDDKIFFEYLDNGGTNHSLMYFDRNTETYNTVSSFLSGKFPNKQYQYLAPDQYCSYNDKLFLSTNYYYQRTGNIIDRELGVYNPKNGSSGIVDVLNGDKPSQLTNLTPLNGSLYFIGYHDASGLQSSKKLLKYYEHPTSINTTKHTDITTNTYPNPTNANTTLELQLDKTQTLSIKLRDITGRMVHSVPTREYTTGMHNITLPMKQLPNGTYFYSIRDNNGKLLTSGKLVRQ